MSVPKKNKFEMNGRIVYVASSRKEKNGDTFHPLLRDKLAQKVSPIDPSDERSLAFRDAYALVFWLSGGSPVPVVGDLRVTRSFIDYGILLWDKEANTIAPGKGLPMLVSSGPEHRTKDDRVYQAILEPPTDSASEATNPDDAADETLEDIQRIYNDGSLDETTRKTLVNARLGQGKFRQDVLKAWGNACAVTGCTVSEALRASHVIPWRDSSNDERLDPENGLPLVATLDALFDRNLITFAPDGTMCISGTISDKDREAMGLREGALSKPISDRMRNYLESHAKRLK